MTDTASLLTFLTALFFLEITPGPDMMLVMARGIGQGRRIALLTVVGQLFLSGFVQVGLLVLGLASLLQAHPSGLAVLQWAGAAYLFYLGVRLIRSSGSSNGHLLPTTCTSSWQALREGAINNLTNPKSLLFMFAFSPQFVDPASSIPVWVQLLVLGSIQKLVGIFSLGGVAIASGTVGQWLYRWPRLLVWQKRFTGVAMLALGLRLVITNEVSAPGGMTSGR